MEPCGAWGKSWGYVTAQLVGVSKDVSPPYTLSVCGTDTSPGFVVLWTKERHRFTLGTIAACWTRKGKGRVEDGQASIGGTQVRTNECCTWVLSSSLVDEPQAG